MTETILQLAHRPRTFDEVVGQSAAVKALQGLVERDAARAFLFSGPSGVGKTTLARITARALGCEDRNVLEVDAATRTGVDAMREIQEITRFRPFGASPWRGLIIDECHALSRQAWQSLLKVVEEPPPHVAWFLCTTEVAKVPQTVKTRCAAIQLRPVPDADMRKLLDRILRAERTTIPREVCEVVVREAAGSPRQMLVNAAVCVGATSRREASELLRAAHESEPVAELGKFLLRGGTWAKAASLLAKLSDEAPESVRIGVCNYVGGALRRARSDRDAMNALAVLEEFAVPFPAGTESAMLAVAVGRIVFGGGDEE